MASYHSSFTYLEKNSADEGYILAAFEPDDGFTDTFLGMDQVYEDYYDGTKRFLYGTRYNNKAIINITIIKADGTDWTINDNRKALKWLTGSRTASWLDLYQGDKIKYSFLGTVGESQQYKLDGRVVGISFTFLSITPWAYSEEQFFDRSIQQALLVDSSGILTKEPANEISISDDGVLCNSAVPSIGASFCVDEKGILYVKDIIVALIDNETDDLYSYIYLDIEYNNETCTWLEIKRKLCDCDTTIINCTNPDHYEITRIDDLQHGDIVNITSKQFIIKYTKNQNGVLEKWDEPFGDSFNFVWPRLAPGENLLIIEGDGNGTAKFRYRYPMKVGDCAMDISEYGGDIICGNCDDNETPTYDVIRWQDITGTPTTLEGYGIVNAYTDSEVYNKVEVDTKIDNIEVSGGGSVDIDEDELNKMLEDILT